MVAAVGFLTIPHITVSSVQEDFFFYLPVSHSRVCNRFYKNEYRTWKEKHKLKEVFQKVECTLRKCIKEVEAQMTQDPNTCLRQAGL